MTRALMMAVVVFLPAILFVSQRTEATRSGYAISRLREEVSALQSDSARLLAAVVALRSPERIEEIAVSQLGMITPKPQQLAALTLPPLASVSPEISAPSAWHRFTLWLLGGEAQARETR